MRLQLQRKKMNAEKSLPFERLQQLDQPLLGNVYAPYSERFERFSSRFCYIATR